MTDNEYLTVEQVAKTMGVTPGTVRAWLRTGKMAGTRPGKDWRIPASALDPKPSTAEILDRLAARLAALPPDRLAALADALGDD